jgi:hypothetical protein
VQLIRSDKNSTCDVQTLLNVTKIMVCTNHAKGRSLSPSNNPAPRAKIICGTNDNKGCDATE